MPINKKQAHQALIKEKKSWWAEKISTAKSVKRNITLLHINSIIPIGITIVILSLLTKYMLYNIWYDIIFLIIGVQMLISFLWLLSYMLIYHNKQIKP